MENYSTDAILYENVLEASNEPTEENYDSSNEVDSKPMPLEDKDFEYEINPLARSLGKFSVTDVVDEAGDWVINEDIDIAYMPVVASNSLPSYTNTEVDRLFELETLITFHLPIQSSLISHSEIVVDKNAIFEVPARQSNQRPIVFENVKTQFRQDSDSENDDQKRHLNSTIMNKAHRE